MKKTLKAFMLVLMSVSFLAFTSCSPKDEPTPDTPTPDNPTPDNPTPDNPTTSGDSWAYLINETPHDAVVTPADNPTVAIAMVIENGDSGGATAAPKVGSVLKTVFGEARR